MCELRNDDDDTPVDCLSGSESAAALRDDSKQKAEADDAAAITETEERCAGLSSEAAHPWLCG